MGGGGGGLVLIMLLRGWFGARPRKANYEQVGARRQWEMDRAYEAQLAAGRLAGSAAPGLVSDAPGGAPDIDATSGDASARSGGQIKTDVERESVR